MTHQSPAFDIPGCADAGRQVAQLGHILTLVERIAGSVGRACGDAALDRSARVSSAYADAVPIVQRRFDALAEETAIWAAAGVEILLAARADGTAPVAAAAALAEQLDTALRGLDQLLRI